MLNYFIFIFVVILLLVIAEVTRKKGFEKLSIERSFDKGEYEVENEIKVTLIIKNNKWLPIPFLIIDESLPTGLGIGKATLDGKGTPLKRMSPTDRMSPIISGDSHLSKLSISRFQKVKRTYLLKAKKRGVYLIKSMEVTMGDIFGFSSESMNIEDYLEIIVYPHILNFKDLNFNYNSVSGDVVVKRWIYKDPLYIKSIREYNVEDRMKDIHWKSSLKMSKLMVKDYDYTSDREIIIIINVQCGEPYWSNIDGEIIEKSINIAVALANSILKDGIPVGMWTNSRVINYKNEAKSEVKASAYSLKNILELCARIGDTPSINFNNYLKSKFRQFSKNCTYIIITSFLDDESLSHIRKLKLSGFSLNLIDVSKNNSVPFIKGVEKLSCGGDEVYE
jgi:uncharacterized protein (DUF58 family)